MTNALSISDFLDRANERGFIVEQVERHHRLIDLLNPTLNAVVAMDRERTLRDAEAAEAAAASGDALGPLHGVPFTLKDVFDSAGLVTASGTQGCAKRIPEADCTILARLRAAGAILLGKSNTSELSLAFESENLVYGRTLNPYDLERSPGGSSGGGAAAVAAGLSYFDVGSDAGGSIRVPAHFCGVAGLKTTSGRVPLTGCTPPVAGPGGWLVAAGPIARTVGDLRRVLDVIQGPDELDLYCTPVPGFAATTAPLRALYYPRNPIYEQHPEVTRLVSAAVDALSDAGVEIVEADDHEIIDDAFQTLMQVVTADGAAWIRNLLEHLGTTEPHPWTKETLEALEGEGISAEDYMDVIDDWEEIRRYMIQTTRGFDLVVSPVVSTPTLPHGELVDIETIPAYAHSMLHNITGWPAVSVPAGLSSAGLPIGFQIAAKRWREADCLRAAELVESKLGGWVPPPLGATE